MVMGSLKCASRFICFVAFACVVTVTFARELGAPDTLSTLHDDYLRHYLVPFFRSYLTQLGLLNPSHFSSFWRWWWAVPRWKNYLSTVFGTLRLGYWSPFPSISQVLNCSTFGGTVTG